MSATVGEPIKVVAIFAPRIRPAKFKWKGRIYQVKEITYTWTSMEGNASLVHFSVSDGATLFEIIYNASAMTWSLGRVEA